MTSPSNSLKDNNSLAACCPLAKVLVILISSGENEYRNSRESVLSQKDIIFEITEIQGLPNLDAHIKLYNTIKINSGQYSYFVKVDADMVFRDSSTLNKMILVVDSDERVDHAVFSVFDWYSMQSIMGMHVYSSRCSWADSIDKLFVDPDPQIPGTRMYVWGAPAPVADHSPNPSPLQAFQFGYHRCLKLLQRESIRYDLTRSYFQFLLLKSVYLQLCMQGDLRRKLVLHGANRALDSGETIFRSRDSFDKYQEEIFSVMLQGGEYLDRKIARNWGFCMVNRPIITAFWAHLPQILGSVLASCMRRLKGLAQLSICLSYLVGRS